MTPIIIYRLKHKPTGLYYTKGTLSEKGKIYTSSSNYCTYLGKYGDILHIPRNSKLAEKYPILSELDCTTAEEFERGPFQSLFTPPIQIKVTAADFEKEYFTTV